MRRFPSIGLASGLIALCGGAVPCDAYTFTLLHRFNMFDQTQGEYPTHLKFDAKRNAIYGTTESGGDARCGQSNGCGVVFELTADANGQLTVFVQRPRERAR